MKRYLLLLLILTSCVADSEYMTEPRPDYEWLWEDNTVYYYFYDDSLPEKTKEVIREGFNDVSDLTNVRVIEASGKHEIPYDSYVIIYSAPFSSGVEEMGMQPGFNKMYFQLIDEPYIAQHELMHELGIPHEQNMEYRDNDIDVHYENIYDTDRARRQFEKSEFTFGKYNIDFESIMLYESTKYSKNGDPVLTKKNGSTWGLNTVISQGDIQTINYLYPPLK